MLVVSVNFLYLYGTHVRVVTALILILPVYFGCTFVPKQLQSIFAYLLLLCSLWYLMIRSRILRFEISLPMAFSVYKSLYNWLTSQYQINRFYDSVYDNNRLKNATGYFVIMFCCPVRLNRAIMVWHFAILCGLAGGNSVFRVNKICLKC